MSLKGKHIILGISGSIAAYKAAILVRMLAREGAEVQVIMTPAAKEFITPLTLAALSNRPVLSEMFNPDSGDWNSHIDLGIWADLLLVAPVTASTIGKMTAGIADNLLITTYLSARCPVFIAPAMDLDMYAHPSTQANIRLLESRGVQVIEPGTGELASGLEGKGRMQEPDHIASTLRSFFELQEKSKKKLRNKKVLITAGPTHEAIDPVRYIGNHSSGKMGYALANAFAQAGAAVTLVSGPVSLGKPHPDIDLIQVNTASEMYRACMQVFPVCDIGIMAAAVADYAPANPSSQKIKRSADTVQLELIPNKDIAAELGKQKKTGQLLIGFALETREGIGNARQKLVKKKLDLIVLNSLEDAGAGFVADTNKITILGNKMQDKVFQLKSKQEVALDILEEVIRLL